MSAVPLIVIFLPLEGAASIRLICGTFEEEARLWSVVASRDPMAEIERQLELLLEVLRERREAIG